MLRCCRIFLPFVENESFADAAIALSEVSSTNNKELSEGCPSFSSIVNDASSLVRLFLLSYFLNVFFLLNTHNDETTWLSVLMFTLCYTDS